MRREKWTEEINVIVILSIDSEINSNKNFNTQKPTIFAPLFNAGTEFQSF